MYVLVFPIISITTNNRKTLDKILYFPKCSFYADQVVCAQIYFTERKTKV